MARLLLRSICLATSRSTVMLARTPRRSRRVVEERAIGRSLSLDSLRRRSFNTCYGPEGRYPTSWNPSPRARCYPYFPCGPRTCPKPFENDTLPRRTWDRIGALFRHPLISLLGATLVMRFLTTSSTSPTLAVAPIRPAMPTTSRTSRPSSSSTSPSPSSRSRSTAQRTQSSPRPTLPPLPPPVASLSTSTLPRAPKSLIPTMSLGHDEGFHTSHSGVAHRTLT